MKKNFVIQSFLILLILSILGSVLLSGCSSANNKQSGSIDLSTGRHITNWSSPTIHGASAKSQSNGFSICQECHGNDFSGGITSLSCFSCHGVNAPHASKPWRGGVYTHTNTDQGNAAVCAQCHMNGANSTVVPATPAPAGTAPGCFNNTLCHAQTGHAAGWSDPAQHGVAAKSAPAATTGFAQCETCHGTDFSGGAAQTSCFTCHGGSGPHPTSWISGSFTHTTTDTGNAAVCAQCHANGANSPIAPPSPAAPAGTAPGCFNSTLCHATPTCGTCHGIPPSGTAFPNIAGTHAPHMNASVNTVCGTCHSGAGSGTALHQNGTADVIFDATYNAKSGAVSYNGTNYTCSNVSCHGGKTTPSWLTGSIDVNTQCTSCHASGTTQYNSYNSGRHSVHSGYGCTECHDTTKLASVHFNDLNTTAMTQAYKTLLSTLNYTGTGGGTYGTCTLICHSETHSARTW